MIAIKDMEMPKDCESCPFYTYYDNNDDDCRLTGLNVGNIEINKRHPKCPLIDITSKRVYI